MIFPRKDLKKITGIPTSKPKSSLFWISVISFTPPSISVAAFCKADWSIRLSNNDFKTHYETKKFPNQNEISLSEVK